MSSLRVSLTESRSRAPTAQAHRLVRSSECVERQHGEVRGVVDVELDGAFEVAAHEERMGDARANRRIQPRRPPVRGHRRVEKADVSTGVHQPRVQFRIAAAASNAAEQPHHGLERSARFNFEVGIEMMRQRQIRVDAECPLHRFFRLVMQAGSSGPGSVLAHDAEASAEARPGRRVRRIGLDSALIGLMAASHCEEVALSRFARR